MKKIINCADKISLRMKHTYSNFSCMLLNPNIFFQFSNSSNLLYLRNLQEQVKQAFCYQKLFWPFTVWINCSSDHSRSLEQFFLTVGQNNFGNKIPFVIKNLLIISTLQTVCFPRWVPELIFEFRIYSKLTLALITPTLRSCYSIATIEPQPK